MDILGIEIFSYNQFIGVRSSSKCLEQIAALLDTLKIEGIIFVGNLPEHLLHSSIKIVGLISILNRIATYPSWIFV